MSNMDIVTAIITPVVQSLLVPIKKHLGFLVYSSNNAKDMHSKVRELGGALQDMQFQRHSAETSRRVVPHRVPDWLAEAEELIKGRAWRIPTGGVGCFNLKTRYKVGKDSYEILKDINRLMKEKAEMVWQNELVPLSAVSSVAHEEDRNRNRFESRYILLNKALESLESTDISSQKIALCGMGGVGKTTMMEEIKKAASNTRMFDHIVKVVVGEKPNLAIVQQAIEEQTRTGEASTFTIEDNKAEQLKDRFKKMSEEGKKKIFVILDDVWQEFNLKHIGLTSPLQTGFKLLLTSREESVCLQMGVQPSFIFKVEVLTDLEAKKLFWETAGGESHNELVKDIGESIVERCGGLPIAIKTIASTLIGIKEKHEWEDALFRIQNQDFSTFRLRDRDNRLLINIFQFSYENLQDDVIKDIFLLDGLYPEDYDIEIEELVRYGWGLQFFKTLPNIAQARIRVKSCVDALIRSNLLNKSEDEGWVKMHDLVRDFVLVSCSKVKQASILSNADEVSKQLRGEEPYDRILLNCKGLLEFPEDFIHPNLTLLKLMYGDGRLKFPEDFYARMKKLEVLAYNDMDQPKLPQSLTNLRALCLSWCSLKDVDISFLGDLISLEILTLARCDIRRLPSKIGNLKRLKLLELSECDELCIEDGVFQNMGKLEELYMRRSRIRFMDADCKPLKMLNLFALEFQFSENEVVSFDKIERFRISVGCELQILNRYEKLSFKNTLMLNSSIDELRECKVNELFKKTEILHLEVNDMYHLEQIVASPPQNSFCMLKELRISHCESLTYLFTVSMAEGLTELEILDVESCPVLNTLIKGGDSEARVITFSEARVITFHKLKKLIMKYLPELESLCDFVHVMELPLLTELKLDALWKFTSIFLGNNNNISAKQPLLKNENFKEIWPCEITNFNNLRRIEFNGVQGAKVMFEIESPSNNDQQQPLSLLPYLEELMLNKMDMLSHVWKCNNWSEFLIHHKTSFQNLTTIYVNDCKSIKYLFSPPMLTLFSNLTKVQIAYCDGMEQVVSNIDDEDAVITTPTFAHAAIPRVTNNIVHQLPNLKILAIYGCNSLKYVFTFPMLESLKKLEKLMVKNCTGMKAIVRDEYGDDTMTSSKEVVFPNLKSIQLEDLPNVASFFLGMNIDFRWPLLEDLTINKCPQMMVFTSGWLRAPRLQYIHTELGKHSIERHINFQTPSSNIDGIRSRPTCTDNKPWSFHNLIECKVRSYHRFQKLFPSSELQNLQKLETIDAYGCDDVEEVFEVATERTNDEPQTVVNIPKLTEVKLEWLKSLKYIWKSNQRRMLEFPNLTALSISFCRSLEHVFTCSMVRCVKQLQKLYIGDCENMKVIVKKEEEDCDAKVSEIKFPCLKSLELVGLSILEGFCIGKEEFAFESLDTLVIMDCPIIGVFTEGPSVTPNLNLIETNFGSFSVVGEDVNAFIIKKIQEGHSFGVLESYSSEQDEPSSEYEQHEPSIEDEQDEPSSSGEQDEPSSEDD